MRTEALLDSPLCRNWFSKYWLFYPAAEFSTSMNHYIRLLNSHSALALSLMFSSYCKEKIAVIIRKLHNRLLANFQLLPPRHTNAHFFFYVRKRESSAESTFKLTLKTFVNYSRLLTCIFHADPMNLPSLSNRFACNPTTFADLREPLPPPPTPSSRLCGSLM